jgi:tRNA-2-methylthio-N6-dimethylallyladenosine synthase
MKTRRYFIETWGCQMNELDSSRLAGQLEVLGFERAHRAEEADLVLLNTCSVREKAEEKVYSAIGTISEIKRRRPGTILGIAGCVAEQEGEKLLERDPAVDFVLGTGNVEHLREVLEARSAGRRSSLTGFDDAESSFGFESIVRDHPHKAMVTAIEGCDKCCTFCVVPFTRGKERSRRVSEILSEVRRLVDEKGIVEILLLGQTVNAFLDPESGVGFGGLLSRVAEVPGLRRLRFVTSHPKNVDDSMIRAMASNEVICPYLHLPPQSGSNRVLRRMARGYSREEFLEVVGRLRAAIPDLTLSGDVIVGFPGETESEFQETVELLERIRFGSLFTFKYSPRPGTAAARWPDRISDDEKERRLALVNQVQGRIQREENEKLVGRTFEVLVDGSAKKPGQSSGRSPCNRVVNFPESSGVEVGDFVEVRIERALDHSLLGSVEAS